MRNKDEEYMTRIFFCVGIAKIHSLSLFLGCSVETLALFQNLLANFWTYCIVGIFHPCCDFGTIQEE
jgi:hypothetical protein